MAKYKYFFQFHDVVNHEEKGVKWLVNIKSKGNDLSELYQNAYYYYCDSYGNACFERPASDKLAEDYITEAYIKAQIK